MKGKATAILALAAVSALSQGAVTGYAIGYYADYEQTSDSQPADLLYAAMNASLAADTPGDLLSATLTSPLGDVLDMYDASYGAGTYFMAASAVYPLTEVLSMAYPDGTYAFDLTAGGAAPQTATLNVIPADYADTVPYLDGGTFSAMQAWPSGVDAPLTWPAFGHSGGAADLSTSLYLFDYTAGTLAYADYGGAAMGGTTVPGGVMLSGHYYGFDLDYVCQTVTPNAGFGTATGSVSFSRRATGLLHCKANPGTVAGRLTLSDHYYPAGQVVRVQVVAGDGTVEDEQDVVLGDYGYYAFDTNSRGVKTIRFKGSHWLRKAEAGVDLDAGADAVNPVLINGDVDGDDAVTVFDYNLLSEAFDSFPDSTNWNAMADLDGDGYVSVFDYNILSNSFDMVGDE